MMVSAIGYAAQKLSIGGRVINVMRLGVSVSYTSMHLELFESKTIGIVEEHGQGDRTVRTRHLEENCSRSAKRIEAEKDPC